MALTMTTPFSTAPAAHVAPGHVGLDDDTPLRILPADLRWPQGWFDGAAGKSRRLPSQTGVGSTRGVGMVPLRELD